MRYYISDCHFFHGAMNDKMDRRGFASVEELLAWYASVELGVESFAEYFSSPWIEDPGEAAYRVVNSVWQNADKSGSFYDSYLDTIRSRFGAEAASVPEAELSARINAWVNEQTEGMIPAIVGDLEDVAAVLVNAVYLKTAWEGWFREIGKQNFTTGTGAQIQKDFISQVSWMRYYEDDGCQLVVLELQGGVSLAVVLGDAGNLGEKLSNAARERVEVWLPKFEVETSFEQGELVSFLQSLGCTQMFTWDADFGAMFSHSLYVDDIIQKAKVHLDEEGMEAAAATAIIAAETTAVPEKPPEPKLFHADRPFSFFLFREDSGPELLFFGQIVE